MLGTKRKRKKNSILGTIHKIFCILLLKIKKCYFSLCRPRGPWICYNLGAGAGHRPQRGQQFILKQFEGLSIWVSVVVRLNL